jgi:hypothetical protein
MQRARRHWKALGLALMAALLLAAVGGSLPARGKQREDEIKFTWCDRLRRLAPDACRTRARESRSSRLGR